MWASVNPDLTRERLTTISESTYANDCKPGGAAFYVDPVVADENSGQWHMGLTVTRPLELKEAAFEMRPPIRGQFPWMTNSKSR